MRTVQPFLALVPFFVFLIARWLFGICQSIWWFVNGTYTSLQQNLSSFEKSAQVFDILGHWKYSEEAMSASLLNFITVHRVFEHPSIVLRDNVTLYTLTRTSAVFVEAEEGLDVTSSNLGSFLKVAQFRYARRVIIMPIKSFHRLAEEVGDPNGSLVFVGCTGRCGSTLLCQIYEETQQWVALSEPDAIDSLIPFRRSMDDEEFQKVAYNTVRILCKPLQRASKGYVIKITPPSMVPVLLPLHKLYPDAKLLFMYRDGLQVAQSLTKLREQANALKLMHIISNWYPKIRKSILAYFEFPPERCIEANHSISRYFTLWALLCGIYKEMRLNGIPIVAVRYEDLLSNPEYATRVILENSLGNSEMAELDDSLVKKAMKAFEKDSQRGTVFSRSKLERVTADEITPDVQLELQALCDLNGLPRVPGPCILPATITTPKSNH